MSGTPNADSTDNSVRPEQLVGRTPARCKSSIAERISPILVLASFFRFSGPVPDHLRPATPDEIAETLAFALRFDGRRRVHHVDDAMARITAERLVWHLRRSGFVVMKVPPRGALRVRGDRGSRDCTATAQRPLPGSGSRGPAATVAAMPSSCIQGRSRNFGSGADLAYGQRTGCPNG